MAVYSKLLLSTGGGIISSGQQAPQARNTASVLVGLGGTGVHCIRTIKTQVYDRLKPDPDSSNSATPVYSHIRFLGVDSAEKSRQGALTQDAERKDGQTDQIMPLSDGEFFSVANNHLAKAFSSPEALSHRDDLTWLDYEHIDVPDLTDAGAGGIRQIGRFMLMDKSGSFYDKLKWEVESAKSGLTNPQINIHIFSGLSGGTGSGCFLDVCYMARDIAKTTGGTVFGYFFLPDVNLWPIPYENPNVRDYIKKNGYASMQELDYCMNLQYNGGGFVQSYNKGSKEIPWDSAPVDMCHLICATDQSNNIIENAYDYAMNVTAEYLLDFLTDSDTSFDLTQHLSNFRAQITSANSKKVRGHSMAYCVIGASCASVPLREINTYLASELFERFSSICRTTPGQGDVEDLMIRSLARGAKSLNDVYETLMAELQAGTSFDYIPYPDDWKYVRDYGNAALHDHYVHQTADKLSRYTANAAYMMDAGDEKSLIRRVRAVLSDIIKDKNRGPIYAYRMLSAAEKANLLNLIDGLIKINDERLEYEMGNNGLVQDQYEKSKAEFTNKAHALTGNKKRFAAFEFYLMDLEKHNRLTVQSLVQMGTVLRTFREQVTDAASGYYAKLSRVMETLVNTFLENRAALKDEKILRTTSAFATPMMKIADLKESLDYQIERLNIPGMLNSFMSLLLSHEEDWIQDDENRIVKLVSEFFLQTAFSDFANRTITLFLKDKYQQQFRRPIDDRELASRIHDEWMVRLAAKASPLFYFNGSIWQEDETGKLAYLSYPSSSAPIKAAAEQLHKEQKLFTPKNSAMTDRIFVMCSACGLPLSAYNNCKEYEKVFFSSQSVGRHYYEGRPVKGMKYNDWRNLPSILPQSVLVPDQLPPDLAASLTAARELYAQAREADVLDSQSRICRPDEKGMARLREAAQRCEAVLEQTSGPEDFQKLDQAVQAVSDAVPVPMVPTGIALPNDGNRKDEKVIYRIQEDHFVSSPALHDMTREILSDLREANETAEAVRRKAEERKREISLREEKKDSLKRSYSDYCDALFSGVIVMDGRKVFYPLPLGRKPLVLSQFSDDYPFGKIPVYQGYLSYQKLEESRRKEMREKYQKRMADNAPEMLEAVQRLKGDLSEEKLTGMVRMAESYKEEEEIGDFLERLYRDFETFCMNL